MAVLLVDAHANIFHGTSSVLVVPTNASGVMGAGLALKARRAYPSFYRAYVDEYNLRKLLMGKVFTHRLSVPPPMYVVGLHTMREPGQMANADAIRAGLRDLGRWMMAEGLTTADIPALGCGIGRLDYKLSFLPLIEIINDEFPSLTWNVYPPHKNTGPRAGGDAA